MSSNSLRSRAGSLGPDSAMRVTRCATTCGTAKASSGALTANERVPRFRREGMNVPWHGDERPFRYGGWLDAGRLFRSTGYRRACCRVRTAELHDTRQGRCSVCILAQERARGSTTRATAAGRRSLPEDVRFSMRGLHAAVMMLTLPAACCATRSGTSCTSRPRIRPSTRRRGPSGAADRLAFAPPGSYLWTWPRFERALRTLLGK